jgi:hypothetical protein
MKDITLCIDLLHDLVPVSRDVLEVLGISCTVPSDVWGRENIVKVEPGSLELFPGLDSVSYEVQTLLPHLCFGLEALNIPTAHYVANSRQRLI